MMFLIDFGVKGLAALGVAFLVALALRRGSASLRYAMWTCALAALLVLPLASWMGPVVKMPVRRSAWRAVTEAQIVERTETVVIQARRPVSIPLPVMIWIGGMIVMLARIGVGHWRVRSLFGRAEEVRDPRWLALVREIEPRRTVVLRRSTATDVPLSYGLFRAVVLLPGEADNWSDERRRIVLSHEMIHARRLDLLWGLVAQCALAAHWFNPLAWLAAKQFRREQERSCDDAVVMAGTASAVYAGHLIDVARSIAIPEAALGMADGFDLEGRVHALLDGSRNRRAVTGRVCAAMLGGAIALTLPLAAIRAQSIASPAPQAVAVAPVENAAPVKREVAVLKAMRRAPVHAESTPVEEPQVAPRASLAGTVLDPSGAVIPRATISLKNTGGPNEEAAVSNLAGGYTLPGILAGEYLVTVSAPGFALYQKALILEAGATATANFSLTLGSVRFTTEIMGKRPQVAAAASTPERIRVGGNVQPVKLISKVEPVYPADAQAEGIEGTVLLRAVVSKNGGLLNVTSVSDVDQRLVNAAIAAVSLWQYQPTLLNGEPVEVVTTITVAFRLN
jgi:TonB family protein